MVYTYVTGFAKRGLIYTYPIFQLLGDVSCFKTLYSSKLQECVRPLFTDLVTLATVCSYSLIHVHSTVTNILVTALLESIDQ